MSHDLEVIVAGGGPAGAAAALVLARCGRRVLLAGGAEAGAFRVGEALPPAARPLLRDLGVLDRFQADGHRPSYGNVSAWSRDEPATTDFLFDPNGHGWHLDRSRFDATLRDAARAAGVDVCPAARLVGAERDGDGWRVTLTEGEAVRANWLIDATGRRAVVARRAGAAQRRDDTLVAFFARYGSTTGTDTDSRTLIESGPDGWWYAAQVPSGERVVAFLTDADLVDRVALLTPTGFAECVAASRHVRAVLAAHGYAAVGPPRGADASTCRLDCAVGSGWVAVGDAAIAFDPLSSQGILTALYTGLRAGQAIDRALAGDDGGLAEYAARVETIRATYDRNRAANYAAETRWLDRPFWKRRSGRSIPTEPENRNAI